MSCFTIISFYTPDFAHFGSTLKSDCEQFGYSHNIVEVDASDSLTEIWDRKIDYILHSIKHFPYISHLVPYACLLLFSVLIQDKLSLWISLIIFSNINKIP